MILEEIANILWDEFNSRVPIMHVKVDSREDLERRYFVRAMHELSISVSSTKPARENKYLTRPFS